MHDDHMNVIRAVMSSSRCDVLLSSSMHACLHACGGMVCMSAGIMTSKQLLFDIMHSADPSYHALCCGDPEVC
jgi:hypothetical protein